MEKSYKSGRHFIYDYWMWIKYYLGGKRFSIWITDNFCCIPDCFDYISCGILSYTAKK